ncbi:hypothetical protein AB1M95_08060 [Sulfitobacter sp. LCG007]
MDALADAKGRPIRRFLSAGQTPDDIGGTGIIEAARAFSGAVRTERA